MMVCNIYVFRPWSHFWQFCQFNSTQVVFNCLTMHFCLIVAWNNILTCQFLEQTHDGDFASLIACERDTYSAPVLDSVMMVWSFDLQVRMQSLFFMINPIRDFAVVGSSSASDCIHDPEKSASAYTSNPFLSFGFSNNPLFLACLRYFNRCTTASPCDFFGLLQMRAH